MHWKEEPRDNETMRLFRSSPLDYLATMPATPPHWRPRIRMGICLFISIYFIYFIMPRLGMSPFHTRQDGMDFYPYQTELAPLPPGVSLPSTAPEKTVSLNLLGNWPGWQLAQYSEDERMYLALRDADGQLRWRMQTTNVAWLGHFELQTAHPVWYGGWEITFRSPHIVWGKLYLSPLGEPRLMRHEPDAAGKARLNEIDEAGMQRALHQSDSWKSKHPED